jgi:hydrogenase maturation protein HypF
MERRVIAVDGVVQGVGFRPFVYGLAVSLDLRGFVKNQTGGVVIDVEGETSCLDRFVSELTLRPPPLSSIDSVCWARQPPRGESRFRIEPSEIETARTIYVGADVATCPDCLAELFHAADRRYRYPFINCTHCGPRLTILMGAPYDRERTSMAAFPMCAACRVEFEDPTNRRFHAQATACPTCGPNLRLRDGEGRPLVVSDPLAQFAEALRAGQIGAIKGLGGYHLACDAGNATAVHELRRRKLRDEKPFALMARDIESAEAICDINRAERELLLSPRQPIVLLRKRSTAAVSDAVAPMNSHFGVMLPYTPLHHLLLEAMSGAPLVMTSGNRSDEPIAYDDRDAQRRLSGIADLFLTHDRTIYVRCDDAVTRVVGGRELPVRRSRGDAPLPIKLPVECPRPILAVGGQFKVTFALGRGRHAFLSHHLGDLDHADAYRAFMADIALYQHLFAIAPGILVHDLHPDYTSTHYALERAAAEGIPTLAVQHHHAHMAGCMAEHSLVEPVIGVAFDGTGFGIDGTIWGGEFLIGDYRHVRRAAHLRPVCLPGGDKAVREPWRMAVAYLRDAGESPISGCASGAAGMVTRRQLGAVEQMIDRRFNTPMTSSAGRLFDAVAALVGLRDRTSYEGQAAMELEWRAAEATPDGTYSYDIRESRNSDLSAEPILVVDTRPLIREIAADVRRGIDAAIVSRRFHSSLADIIVIVCGRLRTRTGLACVVLTGGVFMNAVLTSEVDSRLCATGFRVYRHQRVPPNDGGLSLGQVVVATQQLDVTTRD